MNPTQNSGSQTATLGGGCFWCLEAVFDDLKGVTDVVSGYSGGHAANPTYQQVCSGSTGHAEVVQVTFDPAQISFREILEVFFSVHDPTTLNRQGADVGTQYRSVIFYHNEEQKQVAQDVMRHFEQQRVWSDPIVTQLAPFEVFYPAEDYHQDYLTLHPTQPYIVFNDLPKIENLKKLFAADYRDKPALVRGPRVSN